MNARAGSSGRGARVARRSGGFTLVELLVVISIIALLISILLSSLKKARTQAKRVVCASRLKQLHLAHLAYALDNNGVFVPAGLSSTGSFPLWYLSAEDGGAFAPYWCGRKSEEEPLLRCPSDRDPYPIEKNPAMAHDSQTSYGLNSWARRSAPGSNVYERWGPGGNTLERCRHAGTTMLMAEIWRWHAIMDRDAVATGTWDAHYAAKPGQELQYPGNLEWDDAERHGGVLNFLFVDGHVSPRKKSEGVPKAAEEAAFWGPGYETADLSAGDSR
ncbi:MAG TPA: prepilin-type N-terminal cleavage/methylation domain-containing protein [Phycisphaerae bacterium]|nr:prepilin-type N-terminal cleavage/methylation domain-containing protein [Phycisphaerales bacterium]HRX86179.1 prepilin-type N-terminal cleavage/methylation domain-containing protein [Phycisphaerae bacterium]